MAQLILASASRVRARLLESAGVAHEVVPSAVDEQPIKVRCRDEDLSIEQTVLVLSKTKALSVSENYIDSLVIGADQILYCEGKFFDKPNDMTIARDNLKFLQGRRHDLVSGMSVVRNGQELWTHVETSRMTLLPLSDTFIDDYLENSGPDVLNSVGVYFLEGRGAQLLEKIDGDFFSILGLPLLPLLAFLRRQSVLKQ